MFGLRVGPTMFCVLLNVDDRISTPFTLRSLRTSSSWHNTQYVSGRTLYCNNPKTLARSLANNNNSRYKSSALFLYFGKFSVLSDKLRAAHLNLNNCSFLRRYRKITVRISVSGIDIQAHALCPPLIHILALSLHAEIKIICHSLICMHNGRTCYSFGDHKWTWVV